MQLVQVKLEGKMAKGGADIWTMFMQLLECKVGLLLGMMGIECRYMEPFCRFESAG